MASGHYGDWVQFWHNEHHFVEQATRHGSRTYTGLFFSACSAAQWFTHGIKALRPGVLAILRDDVQGDLWHPVIWESIPRPITKATLRDLSDFQRRVAREVYTRYSIVSLWYNQASHRQWHRNDIFIAHCLDSPQTALVGSVDACAVRSWGWRCSLWAVFVVVGGRKIIRRNKNKIKWKPKGN